MATTSLDMFMVDDYVSQPYYTMYWDSDVEEGEDTGVPTLELG